MAEAEDDLQEQLVLADLVNRVLDQGVSVMGDVMISVAGVDLVHLGLRLDLAAVEPLASRTASARLGSLARSLQRGSGEG